MTCAGQSRRPRLRLGCCRELGRQLRSGAAGCPEHRRRRGSWWSGRSASARSPDFGPPFCAGGMLMRPDDRGIDDQMFEVGVLDQDLKDARPRPAFGPAAKAPEGRVPIAELRRQITPGCTGASHPKHCFYKQAIVPAVTTWIAVPNEYPVRASEEPVQARRPVRRRENDERRPWMEPLRGGASRFRLEFDRV